MDVAVDQPSAGQRHEPRRGPGRRGEPVTGSLVVTERPDRRRVQGQLAGLAELSVLHRQPSRGEVDIITVQRDRLTDPQASDREQPDQGREGGLPQRIAQQARGGDQRRHLRLGVQVRARSTGPLRQQVRRRDLMRRVDGVQVGREAADSRQPVAPPVRGAVRGLPRPVQGGRDGDPGLSDPVQIVQELPEQLLRPGHPIPQRATQRQVVSQLLPQQQPGHDASPLTVPGQGRASTASASRSTLA